MSKQWLDDFNGHVAVMFNLDDPRVNDLAGYKEEGGITHIHVIDESDEWKLENGIWVKQAPF